MQRPLQRALQWSPLVAFMVAFMAGMEWRFPAVGFDYWSFGVRLLEGRWHFAHQGLRPLLYAVHLCGGLPMYGHPNDFYYSLMQLLALVMDPWRAMELSVLVFLVAGYAGWMLFGRDVLRLGSAWAHAFAMIVTAHGFFFLHVMAGHLNFFTFPLIGWLLWLLFGPESRRFPPAARAAVFALLNGLILYAAGYFVLIFFAMLLALSLPLLLLYRKELSLPSIRLLTLRGGGLIVAALLLCASKLIAIVSLMQVFPRTVVWSAFPFIHSPAYIIRALWAIPQRAGLFVGVPWDFHEQSMFLSPVVLLGLLLAFSGFAVRKNRLRFRFAFAYGIALAIVCMLVVSGTGVAEVASALPGLSSMRVSTRLLYVFSLIFSAVGMMALRSSFTVAFRGRENVIAVGVSFITVACFVFAYFPTIGHIALPIRYDEFRVQMNVLEAADFTHISPDSLIPDDTVFLRTIGIVCSQDALLQWAKQPQQRVLAVGSARTVINGAFNLMNPACYAYGPANNCKPGDRIALDDRENLENFLSGRPVTWRVSAVQGAGDWASIFSLIASVGILLAVIVKFLWTPKPAKRSSNRKKRQSRKP